MNTDLEAALTPQNCPLVLFQNPDQRLIWEFFEQVKCETLKKNIDYGSSVFEPPVLAPGLSCTAAIRVRMSDKIKRLQKFLDKPEDALVKDESPDDTMRDLGVYAFLYLMAKKRRAVNAVFAEAPTARNAVPAKPPPLKPQMIREGEIGESVWTERR